MEKERLCSRCMRSIGLSDSCPYCSAKLKEEQKDPYLPLKTMIAGRYHIGNLVGTDREGNTYAAFDMELKKPVTIRELYPEGCLSRGEGNYCCVNVGKVKEFMEYKEAFVKMWETLKDIKGFTAFTEVYSIVGDLGTVYVVSEFLGEGKTLRDYLLEQEQGFISWDEARVLLMPVLSAMGELHAKGIVHGGISPTTLILDTNSKLRITDYCNLALREPADGYAAIEQYGMAKDLKPICDIYAFAAVLYRTLIGSVPIKATERMYNDKLMIPGRFAEMLPAYVINALVNGLQILPDDRTANAEDLRNELSASPVAAGTAAEEYDSIYASREDELEEEDVDDVAEETAVTEETPDANKLKKSTIAAFVISVILCLGVLGAVVFGLFGNRDEKPEGETTTEELEDTSLYGDENSSSDNNDTTDYDSEVVSVSVPDFRGKKFEDIKNDSIYKQVFIFDTSYENSAEPKGTIISQDVPEGTMVSSLNPREITVVISDGLEVPQVVGEEMQDAVEEMEDAGFKNIETVVGSVADSRSKSLKVYSVVYEDTETGDWAELPHDRRLSATDKIIVYYYGEFEEQTTEAVTQAVTEAVVTTEAQTSAEVETPDEDEMNESEE